MQYQQIAKLRKARAIAMVGIALICYKDLAIAMLAGSKTELPLACLFLLAEPWRDFAIRSSAAGLHHTFYILYLG